MILIFWLKSQLYLYYRPQRSYHDANNDRIYIVGKKTKVAESNKIDDKKRDSNKKSKIVTIIEEGIERVMKNVMSF